MQTPSATKSARRRLGLSLRVLMVLVLLLGGGLGWLAYRARVQRDAVAAIEAAGGTAYYDWDYAGGAFKRPPKSGRWPNWLINLVGPDLLGNVTAVLMIPRDETMSADDGLMDRIGQLHRLEWLRLSRSRSMTNAGLACLKGLTNLRSLQLDSTGITGRGLVHLKSLSRLEELSLKGNDLDDDGLAHLAGLTSLRHLDLVRNPGITDAGLRHLETLSNLEEIKIQSRFVTGTGMAHLAKLKHLKSLLLADAQVKDLRPLTELPDLSSLDLYKVPIEDDDLIPLVKLRSLKTLNLLATRITDAGLAHIQGLTDLEVLSLQGSQITDAGLPRLSGLLKCKRLDLSSTSVTPEGVAALQATLTRTKIFTRIPSMPPIQVAQ